MPTQCSQEELEFGSCGGRKLVGDFDGGAITSNGCSEVRRDLGWELYKPSLPWSPAWK